MELRTEIDEAKTEKIRQIWNGFWKCYEDYLENATFQGAMNLYSLTNSRKVDRICEVGVGCGLSSRMFVFELMKPGAVYFASDISDGMVQDFYDRFATSFGLEGEGYAVSKDKKVGIKIAEVNESLDTIQLIEEMGDISKKVFILRANNELLPYPDSFFDVYISNLSLMIVANHHNQLLESYRVLREGGIAAFSVWGRKENTELFTLPAQVLQECGFELPSSDSKNYFHLNDPDQLEKDVKAAGFSEVKMVFAPINLNLSDALDLFNFSHVL